MAKWLKSQDHLLFSVERGVAKVKLNRPEKRNALSPELINELYDAMLEADDRTDVNVVVLEGAGKDFCAGYDLASTYGGDASGQSEKPREDSLYRSARTFDNDAWRLQHVNHKLLVMFDMHKPVIAKVHGNCLAGGMEMALTCDFIIAADDARIGHPATRALGTPPVNMLMYSVGPQWARRLLLSGDIVTGRDAARIGLALDSVPQAMLDEEVDRLAARIGSLDGELLATHKRVVNLALELAGARTLQRLTAEADARAHIAQGPRRAQYVSDVAAFGTKEAIRRRDAPFGRDPLKIHALD